MNCAECVRLVAVADVKSLAARPEVMQHCLECGDCAALVQSISRDTEEISSLYDAIPSGVDPLLVARRAMAEAALRRRRRLWQMRAVTATVLVAFATIFVVRGRADTSGNPMRDMRTFELRCLDEDQAVALIAPMLERTGAVILPPVDGVRAITVRANEQDLDRVEQLILRFDNARVLSTNAACSWREPAQGASTLEPGAASVDVARPGTTAPTPTTTPTPAPARMAPLAPLRP